MILHQIETNLYSWNVQTWKLENAAGFALMVSISTFEFIKVPGRCGCKLRCAPKGPGHLVRRTSTKKDLRASSYAVTKMHRKCENIAMGLRKVLVQLVLVCLKQLTKKKLKKILFGEQAVLLWWLGLPYWSSFEVPDRSRLCPRIGLYFFEVLHEWTFTWLWRCVDSRNAMSIHFKHCWIRIAAYQVHVIIGAKENMKAALADIQMVNLQMTFVRPQGWSPKINCLPWTSS